MWLQLIWQNKRIIAELAAAVIACAVMWWAFWHNPAKIKALEAERQEMARQIEAGQKALTLLDDIQKGKVRINAQVQSQISSIRRQGLPARTAIIRNGGLLPAMPAANTAH